MLSLDFAGMQEQAGGRKVVIYSVWEGGKQNNPDEVQADRRAKMLYRDPKVRVGPFGGEGTGGQSFLDYDWKIGQTYRFLVQAAQDGQRTVFTGYFYLPEDNKWLKLVSFSTLGGGKRLAGLYSFIEDFQRDGQSATRPRRALFGQGWALAADGQWSALTRARFTADGNPATNIDAGCEADRFFLATGGNTANTHTKLNQTFNRPPVDIPLPEGLTKAD